MNVIFTYHSRREESDAVVDETKSFGVQASALPLDTGEVGRFETFAQSVREVLAEIGRSALTPW